MTSHSLVFHSPEDGRLVAPSQCGLLVIPDLLRRVQSWCSRSDAPLVVDLSEVETLGAAVFDFLLWAGRYCAARGVALSVVEPAPGVLLQRARPSELLNS